MGNNQNAELSDVIQRRNERLEKMLLDCKVPVRIIGDPEKPVLIYDEMAFLSVYVSNFRLIFLLEPGGVEVAKVKIRVDHTLTYDKFMNYIGMAQHRAAIKIRSIPCPDICLSGYNFTDKEKNEGRYPVFARHGHKVYFRKKYVDQLVEELRADNYQVEPWVPGVGKDKHHELNLSLDD